MARFAMQITKIHHCDDWKYAESTILSWISYCGCGLEYIHSCKDKARVITTMVDWCLTPFLFSCFFSVIQNGYNILHGVQDFHIRIKLLTLLLVDSNFNSKIYQINYLSILYEKKNKKIARSTLHTQGTRKLMSE